MFLISFQVFTLTSLIPVRWTGYANSVTMTHTCHPLHQYLFLGDPHRLLPQITVALPQTSVTYQHRPPPLCPSMSTT
ncbi:hypothetical protein Hanom_Chr09g00867071 [Helianthus anomalus]